MHPQLNRSWEVQAGEQKRRALGARLRVPWLAWGAAFFLAPWEGKGGILCLKRWLCSGGVGQRFNQK